MRIISGTHRGRNIRPPKNLPVRPTTDKAKEGLFNILQNRVDFEALDVLDLFCGTGNISFEFASRGANAITSVDQNFRCIGFVKSTFKELGFEPVQTFRTDCLSFVSSTNKRWDIVFADPPYDYLKYELFVSTILNRKLVKDDGILIVEHPEEVILNTIPFYSDTRKYGRVHFSFFKLEA